jgi:hypothetical protein
MRQIIILFTLLPLILLAQENESDESDSVYNPLAMTYGVPETNIYGVNVINGDYNYSCVDFELPGADSLIFQRTYSSSQNHVGSFFHGWTQNFSSVIWTGDSYEPLKEDTFNVLLAGSLIGDIALKTGISKRYADIKINREIFDHGVSNCGKGHLSGRTNIKNLKANYSDTQVKITTPDGTEHIHAKRNIYCPPGERPEPEHSTKNDLIETIKPNGTRRTYKNSAKDLHEVNSLTHDNKISNQIEFKWPKYHDALTKKVQSCNFCINGVSKDGKTAKYSFLARRKVVKMPTHEKSIGFVISMSAFESSHLPTENYRYMDRDDGHDVLNERFGKHHKTTIDYYSRGDKIEFSGYPTE